MSAAEVIPGRLRWRCRRGTQELDRLLGWWLDSRYLSADAESRAAFSDLLEQQDPDIWDWLIGECVPDQPRFAAIIDEIRAQHSV